MTIAALLHDAAAQMTALGIGDARLESEVLLAHAAAVDRPHLLARLHEEIDGVSASAMAALLARRLRREPLAYIVGHREFYGIEIACSSAALIPRPESEMLVELALAECGARGDPRIVDVGTGTGAIAIAIAVHAPVRVVAIDASQESLALARDNGDRLGVLDRLELRSGDLLEGSGVFDVVVANLPYVSGDDWQSLQPEIIDYEPRDALVGGERGTEVLRRLIATAAPHLAPGGLLALEIGDTQGEELLLMARASFPASEICVMKDLAGLDRVLSIRSRGG